MDGRRFDALTRIETAGTPSRRGLMRTGVGIVLAALLTLLGRGSAAAQDEVTVTKRRQKRCKGRKRLGQQCKTPKRRGKCKCRGGAKCQGKRCRCPSGSKECTGRCILEGVCCTDADCPSGELCLASGACTCGGNPTCPSDQVCLRNGSCATPCGPGTPGTCPGGCGCPAGANPEGQRVCIAPVSGCPGEPCTSTAECPLGTSCTPCGSGRVCFPLCNQ